MTTYNLVTGGTTGGTNGTAVSAGNKLDFAAVGLNAAVDAHIRTAEYISDDLTIDPPSGVSMDVSFDGGSQWLSLPVTANDTPVIWPVNCAVKLRQTAAAPGSSGSLSTSGLSSPYWSDDFGDGSIDSSRWNTAVDGAATITESGGAIVLDSLTNNTDRALLGAKRPVHRTINGILTADIVQPTTSQTSSSVALYQVERSDFGFSAADDLVFTFLVNGVSDSNPSKAYLRYYNSAGTAQYWTGLGWSSTVTYLPSGAGEHFYAAGDVMRAVLEVDYSNTRIRMSLTHVGNAYTTTTDWVAMSALRDNSAGVLYAVFSDLSTTVKRYTTVNAITYVSP